MGTMKLAEHDCLVLFVIAIDIVWAVALFISCTKISEMALSVLKMLSFQCVTVGNVIIHIVNNGIYLCLQKSGDLCFLFTVTTKNYFHTGAIAHMQLNSMCCSHVWKWYCTWSTTFVIAEYYVMYHQRQWCWEIAHKCCFCAQMYWNAVYNPLICCCRCCECMCCH